MKRILRICAFALTLALLTGCSEKPAAKNPREDFTGRTLEVLLNMGGGGNYYEPVVSRLHQLYPGLTVNLSYETSAPEIFKIRALANNTPDIFNLNRSLFDYYDIIRSGLCYPIDDLLSLPVMDGTGTLGELLDPTQLNFERYHGKRYLFPEVFFTSGLWYDAGLLRVLGISPPQTWQEFLWACEKLKNMGYYALGYSGSTAGEYALCYWFLPMLRTISPDTFLRLEQGDPGAWSTDGMREMVSRLVTLRDKGYFDPTVIEKSNAETQMMFINHQFAFLPCGSWLESEMADAWPDDFELTYLPFSGKTGKVGQESMYATGLYSAIYSRTENLDIVKEFYRVLYSDTGTVKSEIQIHQNSMALRDFDANYGLLTCKTYRQTERSRKNGMEQFNSLFFLQHFDYPNQAGAAINALMSGKTDAETFMRTMAEVFRNLRPVEGQ